MDFEAPEPVKKRLSARGAVAAYALVGVFWGYVSIRSFMKARSAFALVTDPEAVRKAGAGLIQQAGGMSLIIGIVFGLGALWCFLRALKKWEG